MSYVMVVVSCGGASGTREGLAAGASAFVEDGAINGWYYDVVEAVEVERGGGAQRQRSKLRLG